MIIIDKKVRFSKGGQGKKFDAMRGKFITLIDKLKQIISSNTSLEELKIFLSSFHELKPQLACATSTGDVLDIIVKKKCNIVNIEALSTIVNRYDISEARKLITEYEKEIELFSSNMKLVVKQKLSLASSSPLNCEKIEFLLHWNPDDYVFDDISLLLEGAFDDLAKEVVVQIIRKSNSIVIICYAPLHVMNALLLEAQANLPVLLKEMNIIQLTIGHYTVYDRKQEKVNNGRFNC